MLSLAQRFRRFKFIAAFCAILVFLLTRQATGVWAQQLVSTVRLKTPQLINRMVLRYQPEVWRGQASFTHWTHYIAPPDYTDLLGRFGPGNVDGTYRQCKTDGSCRALEFAHIASLKDLQCPAAKWVTLQFYVPDHPVTIEQARRDIVALKQRPAFSEELLGLAEIYPGGNSTVGLGSEIVAVGSEARRCIETGMTHMPICESVVAQLRYNGQDGVSLEVASVSQLKTSGTHFLMVQE